MKTTLKTIASATGVSVTTISRVLSGKAEKYRINKDTAEKVLIEARRCNYPFEGIAHLLRSNKSNSIGLIIPSISNPYFAEIANSVIEAANAKGYTTIVVNCSEDENIQNACISTLLSRKVDGIIAAPCGTDSSIFEKINESMTPVVLVDRYFDGTALPYVTSNNYKGALEATEFLIRNGHKKITCIQGDPDSLPNFRRVNGFRQAMKKNNLEDQATIVGDSFSEQNGYMEAQLLLGRKERPTAIFALSFTILLGVMKAVRDAGMNIPEDISVISFDNNVSLDYMTPPITRIGQRATEMGIFATKMLFELLESENSYSTKLELATELISRDSVKTLQSYQE